MREVGGVDESPRAVAANRRCRRLPDPELGKLGRLTRLPLLQRVGGRAVQGHGADTRFRLGCLQLIIVCERMGYPQLAKPARAIAPRQGQHLAPWPGVP